MVTWVLLLLPLYPLLTYTSSNASWWQRYSSQYGAGLIIYISISFLWLALLGLPERQIKWVSRRFEYLNAHPTLRVQFIFTCVFLTLLTLTAIRQWDWGYNRLLWLTILLLGVWASVMPIFWGWSLEGWPVKRVSIDWLHDWLAQNPSLWLPPLVGVGVLLVSNILGLIGTPRQLKLALALVPGIGALLIFLRWPPLGIIALVITSLIVPSPALPGGLNAAVLLLIFLIGLQVMVAIVNRHPIGLVPSPTVRPLVALAAVAVLAFGVGQLPWFPVSQRAPLDAQLGGLSIFILAPAIFLLIAHQVRDLSWLQRLTWVFVAVTALNVANWLIPPISTFTGHLFPTGTGDNAMFWLWLATLVFSQLLYNQKLSPVWRLVLAGLGIATLYVTIVPLNNWKSGYLPALVSIGVLIGLRSRRTALLLALTGIPVAVYVASQAISTDTYSYYSRLDAWLVILQMIKFNPLTGFGPANYWWYAILFPLRGYYSRFNSHNQYLDIIAQTGFLGLICYLWVFWEVARLGWRLRNRVPAGFARAYVHGVLGGLVGMLAAGMLVDWVLPFTYNIGLTGFRTSMLAWMFLGGLVSIEQIYISRKGVTHEQ